MHYNFQVLFPVKIMMCFYIVFLFLLFVVYFKPYAGWSFSLFLYFRD